jgi:hypothetical protein
LRAAVDGTEALCGSALGAPDNPPHLFMNGELISVF